MKPAVTVLSESMVISSVGSELRRSPDQPEKLQYGELLQSLRSDGKAVKVTTVPAE